MSVELENGTAADVDVDVVVGADGINSTIRSLLWGAHNRTVQGSYTLIRATDFTPKLRQLIDQTPPEHLQTWEIRDRPPLKQWSKGRVTLVGDAALQPLRDLVYDHTPFLQKIVGDATPAHILKQLDEIEDPNHQVLPA